MELKRFVENLLGQARVIRKNGCFSKKEEILGGKTMKRKD